MSVGSLRETSVITEQFIKDMQGYFCQKDLDLIKRATAFAEDHYTDIVHPTGKPYIEHAFKVAKYLVASDSVASVVAATIVSPPPSVAGKVLDELKKIFKGENELLAIIEAVLRIDHLDWNGWTSVQEQSETKERKEILHKMFLLAINETKDEDFTPNPLTMVQFQKKEKQAENLIRMFLAAATDIRALVIKLVDRLYFIKFLKDVEPSRQQLINYKLLAKITLEIYAALADRLGMWRLKSELEDMAFRLLQPNEFKAIARQLVAKKEERERSIAKIIPIIRAELQAFGIKAEVSGRAKHIYSIYQKMEAKQLTFEQINDLLGIRIIVDTVEDCYNAQAVIHEFWPPITEVYDGKPGRDWIAKPKENQYQSLHTTVTIKDKIVEVQIRTHEMHEIAEFGAAAEHWRYKESKTYRKGKISRVTRTKDRTWGRQLAELRKSLEYEQEAAVSMQKGRLKDWIFVITPEGHVIDLPARATPLDFAYRIHTSLGHSYAGAKVGDRYVRIDHELKNGDIVEVITSRARKGPNPEWLSKSKLGDQLGNDESIASLLSGVKEGYIPQWLYRKEEGNKSKDQEGKEETYNKDIDDYMYYVFARTRQARSKIHNWLNKQENESQKPRRNDTPKPKTQK